MFGIVFVSWYLGVWCGIVIMLIVVKIAMRRTVVDYKNAWEEADKIVRARYTQDELKDMMGVDEVSEEMDWYTTQKDGL